MELFNAKNVSGHVVEMSRTNERHMDSSGRTGLPVGENRKKEFGGLVTQALERVSGRQLEADQLFERMITHPDEVEPHDVTIAMAQAEMSLNLTKTIVDRAVKAYNDITAMR
ncbi:MAG: flagellar hook-basal body complex protein FliE [Spirochaetales bacterium]|nr:MAG: flagellar hook-basal body complex protein FliE [Spirochaetales bacterium]